MSEANSYSSIIKSATLIMVCTIVFKLLGFIREFVLAYFFGTSGVSDAFLISQTIPGTLFDFVGAGLTTCFIPIFFAVLQEKGQNDANGFTNKILTIIFAFATLLIVLVWIDTPFFVKIFASGFTEETLALACKFTKIGILSLYFSALVFVYGAYLQTCKVFLPNAATAILQSAIVLLSIYLGATVDMLIMPIGCALAIGLRLIFIYPATKKYGLKTRLDFRWNDKNVKQFFVLLLPVVVGVAVNDLNTIFDRTIASQVSIGAISALTYGNSLIQLANGGVVQPLATVYYPYITKNISEGNINDAVVMLKKTTDLILFIFLPLTAIFMIFSQQITEVLFSRGAFGTEAASMTSEALFFYSIGICFIGIREVLSRYYYANGDTKTPMLNAAIGVVCNILLNLLLSRYIGVGGLALATSTSAIVTSLLLMLNAKKKLGISAKSMLNGREIGKSLVATVLMSLSAYGAFNLLDLPLIFHLVVAIIVSIVVYILLAYLFRMENVQLAQDWFKMKISKKQQYN